MANHAHRAQAEETGARAHTEAQYRNSFRINEKTIDDKASAVRWAFSALVVEVLTLGLLAAAIEVA